MPVRGRFFWSLLLLFLSLGGGVSGFMLLEKMPLVDAFYMTVIVISTVGMNEVGTVSPETRLFLSVYIIFNLAIFAYFLSAFTRYILEGELRQVFHAYMNQRVGNKMEHHVIVCGYGNVGRSVVQELLREQRRFALIDINAQQIEENLHKSSEVFVIEGDATQENILEDAGISRASTLITTLNSDAHNVFVSLTAKGLAPHIEIIARASNQNSISKLKRAGADKVIMPDAIGGRHMATFITRPNVIEFLQAIEERNGFSLAEVRYEDLKAIYQNCSVDTLKLHTQNGLLLVGIRGDNKKYLFNPPPDKKICAGDVIILLGTNEKLKEITAQYIR